MWARLWEWLGNPKGELPGLRGWKTSLGVEHFCEALWKTVGWGQVQTQEYLLPFYVPFPLCSCLLLRNLRIFLTKAGVTELCQLLCSLSLNFLHNLLNAMKSCFSCLLRNTTKSSIHQVWGRNYLHRVTEMLPPVYIAQLVILIKCHLKVLERRNAGKSEVAFHILLISGGGMRHTVLMG